MNKLQGCLACLVNGGFNDKEVQLVLQAIDHEAMRTQSLLLTCREGEKDPAEDAATKKNARDYARLTARVAHLKRQ